MPETPYSIRISYAQGFWLEGNTSESKKEPFVQGIVEACIDLVRDLPNPEQGCIITFGDKPFPDYQRLIVKTSKEIGGWLYKRENQDSEIWVGLGLQKYFKKAPKSIYLQVSSEGGQTKPSYISENDELKARISQLEKTVLRLNLENEFLRRELGDRI